MGRATETQREMEMTEGATVAEPTSVLNKSPLCHRESPGAASIGGGEKGRGRGGRGVR